MKALVVKQPWAELIARGLKMYEIRTWRTQHRGPLLIVAAKTDDKNTGYDIGPDAMIRRGVAACIVNLHDIERMEEKHEDGAYVGLRRGAWAWKLENPIRTEPIKVAGRLGLFEVRL